MNYYYITGTSRGIGKALAERLLADHDNRVLGLARGDGPVHPHYSHYYVDLSDLNQVLSFKFHPHPGADEIALVNNAGALAGGRIGKMAPDSIIHACNVNFLAPMLLTNGFIDTFRSAPARKTILNISSGAGRNPAPNAGTMSATKAGLEMFSRVAAAEQQLASENFRVLSVSPGIVDTAIRVANDANFALIAYLKKVRKG